MREKLKQTRKFVKDFAAGDGPVLRASENAAISPSFEGHFHFLPRDTKSYNQLAKNSGSDATCMAGGVQGRSWSRKPGASLEPYRELEVAHQMALSAAAHSSTASNLKRPRHAS